jgi:hypothetical protein
MPKSESKASRGRNESSPSEFMKRHEAEYSEVGFLMPRTPVGKAVLSDGVRMPSAQPLPPLMQKLKSDTVFRLLREAKKENCPAAYNEILYLWLCRMGVRPPEGVFVEPPGKPGRPRNASTSIIYDKWIEMGKPSLGVQKLAHAIYGADFTRADSTQRKKLVDRCGRAVRRHGTTIESNSV